MYNGHVQGDGIDLQKRPLKPVTQPDPATPPVSGRQVHPALRRRDVRVPTIGKNSPGIVVITTTMIPKTTGVVATAKAMTGVFFSLMPLIIPQWPAIRGTRISRRVVGSFPS